MLICILHILPEKVRNFSIVVYYSTILSYICFELTLLNNQQEGDTEKCISCEAVFHKPCFRKLAHCPCGASLGMNEPANSTKRVRGNASGETNGELIALGKRATSGLSVGLLSGLFSRAKPEKKDHKDSDNVILMGSLPSTL